MQKLISAILAAVVTSRGNMFSFLDARLECVLRTQIHRPPFTITEKQSGWIVSTGFLQHILVGRALAAKSKRPCSYPRLDTFSLSWKTCMNSLHIIFFKVQCQNASL